MTKNQPQKPEKKRPGRKLGVKIRHGAYSLIARGHLPENRRYLRAYLTQCREGLISDLGPKEVDLTTGQKILIDRVIGKLGVLRCLEEYAREQGVIKKGKLSSPLEHNFLAWSNSLRLDLQALGIDKRAGAKVLDLADYIRQADQAKDEKDKADALNSKEIAPPSAPLREGQGEGEPSELENDGPGDEGQGKVEDELTDDELEAEVERLEKRKAVLQDGAKVDEWTSFKR